MALVKDRRYLNMKSAWYLQCTYSDLITDSTHAVSKFALNNVPKVLNVLIIKCNVEGSN